ncbi:hypothetical protein [Sphingobium sp. CR28]|uniref:hypothetical protein n=1 Tax=Sphingobium sp. CR28 TaxID=3400272 RepID=UPI003FEFFF9E
MIRIRRVALIFSLFSAIYWQTASWFQGIINPLTGIDELPLWLVASINFGTIAIYAVITLIFCHRLAGRAARQALRQIESRAEAR